MVQLSGHHSRVTVQLHHRRFKAIMLNVRAAIRGKVIGLALVSQFCHRCCAGNNAITP